VGGGLAALQRKRENSGQLLKKPTQVPPTDLVPPLKGTVESGNTENLSAYNIILKIIRNLFSVIFFHRRVYE
jgi:hypothetical protein